MKTRAELKSVAKQNFISNYWLCVAAIAFVIMAATIIGAIPYVGFLATLFIVLPLQVGLCSFFLKLSNKENPEVLLPFKDTFDSSYTRKLGGSLWMALWVFLWSLLFVIPGIVKSFSYAMTPYILTDCPEVAPTKALKISQRMMKGHKGELFMLQLSFIGWYILIFLAFGFLTTLLFLSHVVLGAFLFGLYMGFVPTILTIFYVAPYQNATVAEYYKNLLEVSIQNGTVSKEELGKID